LIEKESVGIAGPFGYIHSYRGLKKVIPFQILNDGGDVQTRLRADGEPCDVCGLFSFFSFYDEAISLKHLSYGIHVYHLSSWYT
jgi:hypothetical protein